jgi:TetR/AcrR family transcriptional regulator
MVRYGDEIMSTTKLSRKEREKLGHRKEILEAALSLFSNKGFHNVSMQEIADKSEFGIGTLYTFFESKEQLFVELMKAGIERFHQLLIPILESNQEEEKKLSEFIQSHVDLMESNIEFIRLYISQYGRAAIARPVIEDESIDLKKILLKKLEIIIRNGMQKKIFRRVHPEIVALSFLATLEAFSLESAEHFDKAKIKEGFSKIENFFLTSLLKKETDNDTETI